MTKAEMIPDRENPAHNPAFWCLPPVRDAPTGGGRFPMYLVTQGKSVGIWHNWTVVKAMVSGHPSGAQRGHQTMEDCVAEWQTHCLLGVRPHPPAANFGSDRAGPRGEDGGNLELDLTGLSLDEISTITSASTVSSVPADSSTGVPASARYFALWGGRIVYTDRAEVRNTFLEREAAGAKPSMLSSADYDEVQAFCESIHWISRPPRLPTMCRMGPHPPPPPNDAPHGSPPSPPPNNMPHGFPPAPPPNDVPHGPPPTPPPSNGESSPTGPQLITVPKEKCGRHKKVLPKSRPGKLSWVHGTKLAFFARRKDDWLREVEANLVGAFYMKICKLYVIKYRYDMADDQDLAVNMEDPDNSVADEVVHEKVSEDVQAVRTKFLATLRSWVGQWYHDQYGGLLKNDQAAFKELFTGVLDGAPPKPQRGRIIHFYSRKFYETRVKEHVEKRLEKSPAEGESSIKLVAKVTSERWEQESPDFKHECETAMEREYQQALKGWEASLADSPTRTAEEITATLENATLYLQPFVDAIQQHFGMCASVFLAGPVGMRGGRVGVRRQNERVVGTEYPWRYRRSWESGRRRTPGSGGWWKWWRSLQPKERGAEIESEELMRPASADWSQMARMYGKNGLLQVMATLSWWGAAAKRREEDSEAWSVAVKDVTRVLEQILNSGEIGR
ncbi:hypothetical protein B0H14DRAFT_3524242 [Mycena olivaceomarginata]|nr:hypothetical protein B0H14DRAFT_3524242 [Mycena olivaceomarginata]